MRPLKKQNGVAVVEFALVLPFLLMLVLIAFEFGRAFYTYNTVSKTVRDGVRYLTTRAPESAVANEIAKNLVVYGIPVTNANLGSAQALAPGLTTNMVSISWAKTGSVPVVNLVTVTINNYVYTPIFSSVFGLQLFSTNTLTYPPISATMRGAL